MQITREDTGTLTASIKISIGKEDYEAKVNKTLKDYQHKASIPGFRPGKVPFGLISKMYRKGVLLDEMNHLLAESLHNYIEDNQLKLIGNPVSSKEKTGEIDPDQQAEFDFYFDIGMAPEFELYLSEKIVVEDIKITATEKMVDEQIHHLRHRLTEHQHSEEESGADEHHEEHHDEHLPALDETFFSKVFPGEEIKTESEFRKKISETIEQSLIKESDRFFLNSAIEKLVRETAFDLPESFLEKMLRENDDNNLSEEDFKKQYDNLSNSIRWQLIETRIIRDHGLGVDENEMRNVVKGYFTGNMTPAEEDPERDERLNKIVDSVLSNKEEASRLHDQLFEQKLLNFFRSKLKLEIKEVDYDKFIELVTLKKV